MKVFSIITLTKNSADVIAKTLASVSQQSYPHIEHIFVDGRSSDATMQMIQSFPHTKNVAVYTQEGQGIANGFNIGLQRYKGELVLFLNAGDTFVNEHVIDQIIESYTKNLWPWAFGETISVSRRRLLKRYIRQYEKWSQDYFLRGNPMCHQSTIYSRSLLNQVGYFDEFLPLGMDYDFHVRIAQIADPHLLRFPIAYFDTTGVSSTKLFKRLAWHIRLRRKYFPMSRGKSLLEDGIDLLAVMKRYMMIPFKLWL